MSVVNSKKNIVLPNNEEIMVGPDTILYETIPSRENCSTGNISFLVQNKGQNSLLDAEVYLEVFFKLNYKDTNNAAKQPDWTDATTPFLAAFREPMPIIRNSVFIWNGTSLVWQPSLTADVDAMVFDNQFMKHKYGKGGMTNWTTAPALLSSKNTVMNRTVQCMTDEGRANRCQDLALKWFEALPSNNENSIVSCLIPLQFPPFKCGRYDKWYGKMSPVLPFVNNAELQLQFYEKILNNLAIEYFQTKTTTDIFTCELADKQANLRLMWYSVPNSVKMNDVYTLGSWTQDIIFRNSSTITNPVAFTGIKETELGTTTYTAKVQQKPDYICVFNGIDKDKDFIGAKIDTKFCGNSYCQAKQVKITLDTDSGAFSANVGADQLRWLSRQNFNELNDYSDIHFWKFKNFVFLSADQISSMTKIPAGVWANSTIRVEVTWNTPLDPQANDASNPDNVCSAILRDYLVLYSGHQSLRVTKDSCEVIRNGITESAFMASNRGQAGYSSKF